MYTNNLHVNIPGNIYQGKYSALVVRPYPYDTFESLLYQPTENKDSLVISYNTGLDFGAFGVIDWYPPYVKKAKKIDYDQLKRNGAWYINYRAPWKKPKGPEFPNRKRKPN